MAMSTGNGPRKAAPIVPKAPAGPRRLLPPGYIHLGVAKEIEPTLREFGLDPGPVIREAGLDPSLFDDGANIIPHAALGRLLTLCVARTRLSSFRPAGRPAGDDPVPRRGRTPDAAFGDGRRRPAQSRLEPQHPEPRRRPGARDPGRHGPVQLCGLPARCRERRSDHRWGDRRYRQRPARPVRLRMESHRGPPAARRPRRISSRSGAISGCPCASTRRSPRSSSRPATSTSRSPEPILCCARSWKSGSGR